MDDAPAAGAGCMMTDTAGSDLFALLEQREVSPFATRPRGRGNNKKMMKTSLEETT